MNGGELLRFTDQDKQEGNRIDYEKKHEKLLTSQFQIENNLLSDVRVSIFADLLSKKIRDDIEERIVASINDLSEVSIDRKVVQTAIRDITYEILSAKFVKSSDNDILLVPIMRAGLSMWEAANEFFGSPETSFMWGKKEKGTEHANVLWPKRNDLKDKNIILLDPIIATGDTLVQASKTIRDTVDESSTLTVISCYAAPEGVQAIIDKTIKLNLVIGCMAETVDTNGYLVPPTNGDIGDKLFGSAIDY